MKICIPVTGAEGLQALIQPEFTTAEHLLVFDLQTGEHRTFSREGDEGESAQEDPIAVDAVLCAGMDRPIVRAFAAQGIQVFATEAETVAQALEALREGDVEELMAGGCCGGGHHAQQEDHECCGGHDHEEGHECCGGQKHEKDHECGGGHDHEKDHECCGGQKHEEDHECCGGQGGCGRH